MEPGVKGQVGLAAGWLIAPTGGHWVRWRVFHLCRPAGLPVASPLIVEPQARGYICRQCGATLPVDDKSYPIGEVLEIPTVTAVELQRLNNRMRQLVQDLEREKVR